MFFSSYYDQHHDSALLSRSHPPHPLTTVSEQRHSDNSIVGGLMLSITQAEKKLKPNSLFIFLKICFKYI